VLNLYTIATKPEFLATRLPLKNSYIYEQIYQARPGMALPVVISEKGSWQCVSAVWEDGKASRHQEVVPIESVLSRSPYNRLIRTRRCMVPANCFFALSEGKVFCVRILGQRHFGFGALLTSTHGGSEVLSFTLLSCEAPDILGELTSRIPLIVRFEHTNAWLTSQKMVRVMQFADNAAGQWFDFFEVSSRVTEPGVNDPRLLKPQGMSNSELQEREERLRAIKYREDRIIRRNTKGR
jgi:putative SOS response-associated peptidase YedK